MAKVYNIDFNYNMDIVLDANDLESVKGNEEEYAKELLYSELKHIFHQGYDVDDCISIVSEKEINDDEVNLYWT